MKNIPHLNGDDYEEEKEHIVLLEEIFNMMFDSLESIDAKLDVIMSHFSVKRK